MLCQAFPTQMPSIFDPNRSVTAIRMVVSSADKTDFYILRLADAAFTRISGTFVVAAQRVSSFQSFMGVVLIGTNP